MRTAARWLVGLLALVGLATTILALGLAWTGLSARPEPSAAETSLARAARHLLIPRAARRMENPLPASPEVLASASAHWADHCASCHGNDGKGTTAMGRNLYPKAPDMTAAPTQELADGELFWIIENGVKLTGMPAWGTPSPSDDAESWELVRFVRHLPAITATELAKMERLKPVARAHLEEELAAERFLAGEDAPPSEPRTPHH
jgi:cytochrome c553